MNPVRAITYLDTDLEKPNHGQRDTDSPCTCRLLGVRGKHLPLSHPITDHSISAYPSWISALSDLKKPRLKSTDRKTLAHEEDKQSFLKKKKEHGNTKTLRELFCLSFPRTDFPVQLGSISPSVSLLSLACSLPTSSSFFALT